jgi:hypothetical protein
MGAVNSRTEGGGAKWNKPIPLESIYVSNAELRGTLRTAFDFIADVHALSSTVKHVRSRCCPLHHRPPPPITCRNQLLPSTLLCAQSRQWVCRRLGGGTCTTPLLGAITPCYGEPSPCPFKCGLIPSPSMPIHASIGLPPGAACLRELGQGSD